MILKRKIANYIELKEAMEKDAEILEGKAEELEYITDCALEGLRLFAPATLVKRQARKDTVVNGILIPTDTVIELCITAIHQDPKIFPNPTKNIPTSSQGYSKIIYKP